MSIMDSWNIFGKSIADTEISTRRLCKWCKLLLNGNYGVYFSDYKLDFITGICLCEDNPYKDYNSELQTT